MANKLQQRTKAITAVRHLLGALKLEGPNFEDTPERVMKLWMDFLYPKKLNLTKFPIEGKASITLIKNYKAWGFCPHHLLPILYTFRIGYLPDEKIGVLGLSKLARVADYVLSSLPLQEDIPEMISGIIQEAIRPQGIGIVVVGEHYCMKIRGVEAHETQAVNSYMTGIFLTEPAAKNEFLIL